MVLACHRVLQQDCTPAVRPAAACSSCAVELRRPCLAGLCDTDMCCARFLVCDG